MTFAELNGQPRFNENECLSPEQIKSFFRNLKLNEVKKVAKHNPLIIQM